jgi:hypothetical protein
MNTSRSTWFLLQRARTGFGVNASDVALDLPVGDYILTVKATGKDVPPSEAAFRVWADDTGKLRCVAI